MNALIQILAKSGLLTKDLDYHLIRASMVLIFLALSRTANCGQASSTQLISPRHSARTC
jgi:hypothetical protein